MPADAHARRLDKQGQAVSLAISTPAPGDQFASQAKIALNGTITKDAGATSFIDLVSTEANDDTTIVSTDNAVWGGNGDTDWSPGYVNAPVGFAKGSSSEYIISPFKIYAKAMETSSSEVTSTKISVKVKGPD